MHKPFCWFCQETAQITKNCFPRTNLSSLDHTIKIHKQYINIKIVGRNCYVPQLSWADFDMGRFCCGPKWPVAIFYFPGRSDKCILPSVKEFEKLTKHLCFIPYWAKTKSYPRALTPSKNKRQKKAPESESEMLLVTRPNDNHSPGPVISEVSP